MPGTASCCRWWGGREGPTGTFRHCRLLLLRFFQALQAAAAAASGGALEEAMWAVLAQWLLQLLLHPKSRALCPLPLTDPLIVVVSVEVVSMAPASACDVGSLAASLVA